MISMSRTILLYKELYTYSSGVQLPLDELQGLLAVLVDVLLV